EWTVPILMYHSISDEPEPGVAAYYKTNTSPAVFAQQMQFLADQGYRAITLSEAVELLRNGSAVAQVSEPAVSPTSKSACHRTALRASTRQPDAGWETCDTAGLETCATTRFVAITFD